MIQQIKTLHNDYEVNNFLKEIKERLVDINTVYDPNDRVVIYVIRYLK